MPLSAPLQDTDVEQLVELSLRAFAPIHESFRRVLGEEVNARVYPDWQGSQESDVRRICADAGATVWVSELDGRPVGFVAAVVDAGTATGQIDIVAVDPDYQGRGIGHALTTTALNYLRESVCTLATVATGGDPGHGNARRTYERAGFTALPLVRYYRTL